MGEDRARRAQEVAALRAGVERGLTVIDTAEMYAHGGAEEVVGEAIRGLRDRVVLVSKVYPWHAAGQKMMDACEASLRRLGTDYLDMYLLHWAGEFSFAQTVEGMETLVAQGKNSPLGRIESRYCRDAGAVAGCRWPTVRDQSGTVPPASRGIEHDLLTWCQQRSLPVMAYSPLAQAGRLRDGLLNHSVVKILLNSEGERGPNSAGLGHQSSGRHGYPESRKRRTCGSKCRCAGDNAHRAGAGAAG